MGGSVHRSVSLSLWLSGSLANHTGELTGLFDPSTGRAPVIYCDNWDRASASLYIDVYDADLTSDDYLGQARLDLHDYCASSGSSTPKDLELTLTPFTPAGRLCVSLCLSLSLCLSRSHTR